MKAHLPLGPYDEVGYCLVDVIKDESLSVSNENCFKSNYSMNTYNFRIIYAVTLELDNALQYVPPIALKSIITFSIHLKRNTLLCNAVHLMNLIIWTR